MTTARLAGVVVFLTGIAVGIWAGEYSTADWWTLQRQVGQEEAAIARLQEEVESLAPIAEALETDPATQERVAREKFGMVRPGEILYQVEMER